MCTRECVCACCLTGRCASAEQDRGVHVNARTREQAGGRTGRRAKACALCRLPFPEVAAASGAPASEDLP